MRLEKVKLKPFPFRMNTKEDPRSLLPLECSSNTNLITLPNKDSRAHWWWDNLEVNDTTKLIHGHFVTFANRSEALIVFGVDSNGGFVKKITKELKTLQDLDINHPLTGLSEYVVPDFVNYRDSVYIFMGMHEGYDFVVRFDGANLIQSSIPFSSVGLEFRERLWFMDKGKLFFTDPPGYETYDPINGFFGIGNLEEPILCLKGLPDRIIIGKRYEVWELVYTSWSIEDVLRRLVTNKAGIINHRAAQVFFDSCYFYDDTGAYLTNPKKLQVDPSRFVIVGENVVKISEPIRELFTDFNLLDPQYKTIYERFHSGWSMNDFGLGERFNIKIDTNSYWEDWQGVRQDIRSWQNPYAWCISKPIPLPRGMRWGWITGWGWREIVIQSMSLEISKDKVDWIDVDREESPLFRVWRMEIPNELKDAPVLYYRLRLTDWQTQYKTAFLHDIRITGEPIGGYLFGSGLFRDRFYIFAENLNGERVNLLFGDGWAKLNIDGMTVYNLINELSWDDDYNLIGLGATATKGCLVKRPKPESNGDMMVDATSGEVDFDEPELPKKMRKILFTYKCSAAIVITAIEENGDTHQFTAPASTDFDMLEFNLATQRSKFFKFRVETTKSDIVIRDFEVWLKVFGPNEV